MLSQPCKTCGNRDPTSKKCDISCPSGFATQCHITCIGCNSTEVHSNEPDGVDLSMSAAAAGIAGGINHYELTRALAIMGITRQPWWKSYNAYQQKLCQSICKTARECTDKALHDVITHLKKENNNTLSVSFDVSWSHVRNANEASGEFIFQGRVPGKINYMNTKNFWLINVTCKGGPEKPIVAYHTVEKERLRKVKGGAFTSVRKGNFSHSSKQMEHAILIELLEQITPLLEEHDMMLDVTVDGDLDTNKTLARVPVVHQIYADLKHITRNIRKNLGKYMLLLLTFKKDNPET
jgi:hypothetical protein